MQKTARQVLQKLAELSSADIARGLAGAQARPDISAQEIDDYAQKQRDQAYQEVRGAPWWGGGVGGLLGGATGLALSQGSGLGGLLGLAAGGGLGALLGQGVRSAHSSNARMLAEELGNIAQSGRIPTYTSQSRLYDYMPYAQGTQPDLVENLSPDESAAIKNELQNQMMARRALERAATHLAVSRSGDEEQRASDTLFDTALGGGVGALEGRAEGAEYAKDIEDLRERGYGHLAKRLRASI